MMAIGFIAGALYALFLVGLFSLTKKSDARAKEVFSKYLVEKRWKGGRDDETRYSIETKKKEAGDAIRKADAKLIAQAPAMLEALIELIDASENGGAPYRGRTARIAAKFCVSMATGTSWEELKDINMKRKVLND